MTADSQWPLTAAVYTALTGDATLTALVGTRVFNHVPQETAFPYVVIGETTLVPFDSKTTEGAEVVLTIHSWSRYRGSKEILDIQKAVVDVLDKASLTVTGHSLVQLRVAFADNFEDPGDDKTRHGVQRFRALTHA
jgi:hypothetical protein